MALWLAPLLLAGCLVPQSIVDHLLDVDDDGERPVVVGGTDCDDHDLHVGVFAPEVCGNGKDDDCNGLADDVGVGAITVFADGDGDGYGDALAPIESCTIRLGTVTVAGDCDDNNRFDHPNALEDCTDGRDNDCDRVIDEADNPPLWYADVDNDGFGDVHGAGIESCTPVEGRAPNATDCDDQSALARPGAEEVPYDGLDNACDGQDEFDLDGDGYVVDPQYAPFEITSATYAPPPFALDCDDLDPTINPGQTDTPYDGVDRNCDGANDYDNDGDGYASAQYGGADCDDGNRKVHPGALETPYDGVDDDCDPSNDDDVDGDRHAASARGGDDCNDQDALVWSMCATCGDGDLDGRRWGCDAYDASGEDCNDLNANVWASCSTCGDKDADGRFDGCDAYVRIGHDCDDTNTYAWNSCATCADRDGDGRYGLCDRPTALPVDCDDNLSSAWLTCATCVDLDGDGFGTGTCDGPTDCDDNDPNSTTTCGACLDLDGDGSFAACDRYATVVADCDDDDPDRGGATAEILDDGLDQDCDGEDLTVDEAHGVFVTPTGVDDPWCGTRAWPCATLTQGASQVKDRGEGVLFLSEGAFAASWAYSSIYGGFDAASWTRGGAARTTAIVVDPNHEFMVVADKVAIDGLTVRGGPNWAGGRLLKVNALAVTLAEDQFTGLSTSGGCEGPTLEASSTSIERVKVDLDCSGDVIGVEAEPFGSRDLYGRIRFALLEMSARNSLFGPAVGAMVRGTDVRIRTTTINAVSETECQALGLSGVTNATSAAQLIDSLIACSVPASGSSSHGLFSANLNRLDIARTIIVSSGGTYGFGMWQYMRNNDQLVVRSTTIMSNNESESTAIAVSPGATAPSRTTLDLLHATIIAKATDVSVAVDNGTNAKLSATNCVLQSADLGIHTAGTIDLHGVFFDAPCALGDRSTCDASTTTQVDSCTWYSCHAAESCTVGDAGLGGPGLDPWIPNANSDLIDAGVDNSGWSTDADLDLNGTPRPLGLANDIGAIEVR